MLLSVCGRWGQSRAGFFSSLPWVGGGRKLRLPCPAVSLLAGCGGGSSLQQAARHVCRCCVIRQLGACCPGLCCPSDPGRPPRFTPPLHCLRRELIARSLTHLVTRLRYPTSLTTASSQPPTPPPSPHPLLPPPWPPPRRPPPRPRTSPAPSPPFYNSSPDQRRAERDLVPAAPSPPPAVHSLHSTSSAPTPHTPV